MNILERTSDNNTINFTFPIECCDGKVVQTNIGDFRTTGIAPSWEDAKLQVEKYGVSSLGTVGYFINPSGTITSSFRFYYYLNQKNERR